MLQTVRIVEGEWSSTLQYFPEYNIIYESLHVSFQHACTPVHTIIINSILTLISVKFE